MRRHWSIIGAIALVGTVVTIPTPLSRPASAAATSPSVTAQAIASFAVPGTANLIGNNIDGEIDWQADLTGRWIVGAPAGVCAQTITEWGYRIDPTGGSVTHAIPNNVRSYHFFEDGNEALFVPSRLQVRVTDCNGHTATSGVFGAAFLFGRQYEDDDAAIAYHGTWTTSMCRCFSFGTTHYSTTAGDSAKVTVFSNPGEGFALVMEKAANRGSATVYLDGVRRATVNTHSVVTRHTQTVWSANLTAGTHTITVVNRATPGHPRIDLDLVAKD